MTTKDTAAQIRADLKKLGITSRQVSVRVEWLTTDAAIRVLVKDPGVSLSRVREIACRHERIHRDSATGEILGGGNTYLDVEYASSAVEPTRARVEALLEGKADGEIVEIAPGLSAWRVGSGFSTEYWLRDDTAETCHPVHGLNFIARQLAERILDRGLKIQEGGSP